MKRYIVCCLAALSLICSVVYGNSGWEKINMPQDIHSIVIDGRLNVLIDGKSSKSTVQYKADNVLISHKDGVMTFSSTDQVSGEVTLRLFIAEGLAKMNSLKLNDESNLTARGLMGPKNIVINTQGRVLLEGYLNAPLITQKGHAKTEVMWLKGDRSRIDVHAGHLQVAGSLQKAAIKVFGDAMCDAKHLRVDNIWLAAGDQATAIIHPSKELHAMVGQKATVTSVYKPKYTSEIVSQRGALVYQSIFNA